MALDQHKIETILNNFKSMDVETRLRAINEAREQYSNMFSDGMTPVQFAYSARIVEDLYNIIRDELKISQVRVKRDLGAVVEAGAKEPKAKSTTGKKPSKVPTLDMADIMKQFAEFAQKEKG